MSFLIKLFIVWAARKSPYRRRVVDEGGLLGFFRHEFLWPDEMVIDGVTYNRPPWWRPFNILLHCWRPQYKGEVFHDHPRWSITICLRGALVEKTPWGERRLTPGSVVLRSRKAIHSFSVPRAHRGKTWTLFIVGRRNHPQNRYRVLHTGRECTSRKAEDTLP